MNMENIRAFAEKYVWFRRAMLLWLGPVLFVYVVLRALYEGSKEAIAWLSDGFEDFVKVVKSAWRKNPPASTKKSFMVGEGWDL